MLIRFLITSFAFMFLTSCYTLLEGSNIGSSNFNTEWTTNSAGERVMKYDRQAPLNLGVPYVIGSQLTQDQNSYDQKSENNSYPYNNETAMREGVSRGYFELISSGQDLHLGFHAGWQMAEAFEFRLGASAFFSNDPYLGLDVSGRYFLLNQDIQPFVGAGGFIGDTRSCKRNLNGTENCEKKFLGVGYLEAGASIGLLSVFYRTYSMNRAGVSIPARDFIGLGVSF